MSWKLFEVMFVIGEFRKVLFVPTETLQSKKAQPGLWAELIAQK
jgi:hypothetical protein